MRTYQSVGLIVLLLSTQTAVAQRDSGTRPLRFGEQRIDRITAEQIEAADLSILFIGNSHAAPMPRAVAKAASRIKPDAKILTSRAMGSGFLADHAKSAATIKALRLGKWDYVVLQAQKYSTSGRYTYPTDGAKQLTRVAKEVGAQVIMFPEWRRKGHAQEGVRVHKLHQKIAAENGAVVSPVGLAWDAALLANSKLPLHDRDGNHAAPAGNYLTASVLCATITKADPRVGEKRTARDKQLDEIAWRVVQAEQQKAAPVKSEKRPDDR